MIWKEIKGNSLIELVKTIVIKRAKPEQPLETVILQFSNGETEEISVEQIHPGTTLYSWKPEEEE